MGIDRDRLDAAFAATRRRLLDERTAEGHADRFWALALACHAAASRAAEPFVSVW